MPSDDGEILDDDYGCCLQCGWYGLVEDGVDLEDEEGELWACCPDCHCDLEIWY
jgi:hypothetical protein